MSVGHKKGSQSVYRALGTSRRPPGAWSCGAVIGSFVCFGLGCQVIAGYEDFEAAPDKPRSPDVEPEPEPDAEAGTEEPKHRCEPLPQVKEGARGQVTIRVDVPNASCFWMDQTEVTVGEYVQWLETEGDEFDDWDSFFCEWKQPGASDPSRDNTDECRGRVPDSQQDPFNSQKPIRCVDWCDAEAFCRRSGGPDQHLCRDATNGGTFAQEGFDPEWRLACRNSYETDFPWGNEEMEADRWCNVAESAFRCGGPSTTSCGPTRVGAYDECATHNGIQDMVGNVAEWVSLCSSKDATEPEGECRHLGGSYEQSLASADCAEIGSYTSSPKQTRNPDLGFRCCADLSASERAATNH